MKNDSLNSDENIDYHKDDDIKLDNEIVLSLKKSILNLEKSITKNREMRVKYYDQPSRFLDSECDLYNELQSFIMNMPEAAYFSLMIKLNFLDTLFELLSHENTDICACVLQILLEMTDVEQIVYLDVLVEQLAITLSTNNCYKAVYEIMNRFLQEDEVDNCEICLSLIDNLIEFDRSMLLHKPDVAGDLTIFLLNFTTFDQKDRYLTLKLHAADLLAVILHSDLENNKIFHHKNGIKLLLGSLEIYKCCDPLKGEGRELMETLFNILCSCLLFDFNVEQFFEYGGLLLMIEMLKYKKKSCFGALKVLSFIMSGNKDLKICVHTFIEKLGLKFLFPLFLKNIKNTSTMSKDSYDEHFCTIIKALLKNSDGIHYCRVINKFVELGHEKLDRLLEIFTTSSEKVALFDKKLLENVKYKKISFDDYKKNPSVYNERLENGLFTLQLVSTILLELLALNHASIHSRIVNYFHQNSINILKLFDVIEDYCYQLTELIGRNSDYVDISASDNSKFVEDTLREKKRLEKLLCSIKNV